MLNKSLTHGFSFLLFHSINSLIYMFLRIIKKRLLNVIRYHYPCTVLNWNHNFLKWVFRKSLKICHKYMQIEIFVNYALKKVLNAQKTIRTRAVNHNQELQWENLIIIERSHGIPGPLMANMQRKNHVQKHFALHCDIFFFVQTLNDESQYYHTLQVNQEMDPRLNANRHSQNQRLCWLRHSGCLLSCVLERTWAYDRKV